MRFRCWLLVVCVFAWCQPGLAQVDAERPEVVFVIGEGEYRSEWSMPALAEILSREYGMNTTILIDEQLNGGRGNSIEGLEALAEADLAIFYLRFRQLPQDQLDLIDAYVASGKPLVAFRTTTHAFDYPGNDPRAEKWNAFGAEVLGAPWKYHYGHDAETDATHAPGAAEHPILTGVDPEFHVRSWTYHVRDDYPPESAEVLVLGRPVRPGEEPLGEETVNPIAWTHTSPGGGRVFMTTAGHPQDYANDAFRRLVVNGVFWALDQTAPDQPVPDFPRYRERTGQPWLDMDYGPFLSAVVEVTPDNIAPKGIAIPLDADGERAMLFDTGELRWAAGWEGDFVELNGIVYDGPHGPWPKVDGEVAFMNPAGPGVALGEKPSFDDPRSVPYGPLPRDWARWQGLVRDNDGVVLKYTVGDATVMESPSTESRDGVRVWVRDIEVADVSSPFTLSVAGFDSEVEMPAAEVHDLDCGTIDFQPEVDVEATNLLGRTEFVFRRNGEIIGMAGIIGDPGVLNPRDRGQALPMGVFRDGRFVVDVYPPFEGSGASRFRVFMAEGDASSLPAFRTMLATGGRGPDLAARWTESGTQLWPQRLVRQGVIDVEFSSELDEVDTIMLEAGEEGFSERFDLEPGVRASLVAMDGTTIKARSASTREAMVLVEVDPSNAVKPLAGWDFERVNADLQLEGVKTQQGVKGNGLAFDGESRVTWKSGDDIEFTRTPLTVSAWVKTTQNGTIFSQANPEGEWIPDGKTFFIREGHLCYDVGWVGVVCGEREITDGEWHHVAFTWNPETGLVTLWVDGEEDGEAVLAPEGAVEGQVIRLGYTASNFPGTSWFNGLIDGVRIHDVELEGEMLRAVAAESGEPMAEAAAVRGPMAGTLSVGPDGRAITLAFDPVDRDVEMDVIMMSGLRSSLPLRMAAQAGAPTSSGAPFVIDRISWPIDNPWYSWMRFGDFDFLDEGRSAAISTWNGDVWRVDGINADLDELEWQRIASGLSQPLGLKTRGEEILVAGRDQITRLVDLNGDRETDRYEAFNVDTMNAPHFHEPVTGLQEGPDGSLYYMKGARHAKLASHPQHGTLIKVAPDGSTSEIIASGFRAPNGLWVDDDGVVWGSDQEGHWTPANRINRITPGTFHGNNWSGSRLDQDPRPDYDPPLIWMHPTVDRSPAGQVRVPRNTWGDLAGKLLGISYGTGEVYMVLEDQVDGVHQGAYVPLPIVLPTGLMRGRFNPADGDLYLSGMFGWSSNQTEPGGFYRVRRSNAAFPVPLGVRAVEDGLVIFFNEPISTPTDELVEAFEVEAWNYEWSRNYGSLQYQVDNGRDGTTPMEIEEVVVSPDGQAVWLHMPDMEPAMQMHVKWDLAFDAYGQRDSFIHLTVHALTDSSGEIYLD